MFGPSVTDGLPLVGVPELDAVDPPPSAAAGFVGVGAGSDEQATAKRQKNAKQRIESTWHERLPGRYDSNVSSKEIAAAAMAVLTACLLTTDLNGLSSGDAATPGSSSGSAGEGGVLPGDGSTLGSFDAGPDASRAEVLASGGVVIAEDTSSYSAGGPQQHHVHFAANLGAYVVFYLSSKDRSAIRTRLTPDFVTFVDGPSLPLPRQHDNEGRNFDVAYANIGGADIFHLAISIHDSLRYSYRARGRATKGGTITFDSPSELDHSDAKYSSLDPDGPSVAIMVSGRVVVSNGYNSVAGHVGNAVAWVANKPDDGAADWDHAFAPGVEVEVAASSVNARSLVTSSAGLSFLWERADQEPHPSGIDFSGFDGTNWTPHDKMGFTSSNFDIADWNQVVTSDGRVHVLRFADGAYAHRYIDLNGQHDGSTLPALEHSVGDGLVALAKGASPSAYAFARPDKTLKRSTLDGSAWSVWTDVAAAEGTRSNLSGNGDVLMWQRGSTLIGLRLSP